MPAEGDVERLNVSNIVLVLATDADILVMQVSQASETHGGVYMATRVHVLDT